MGYLTCERCGEEENVTRFTFYGHEDSSGKETLCWDCRYPYIRARVDSGSEDGDEKEEDSGPRQAGLGDFV